MTGFKHLLICSVFLSVLFFNVNAEDEDNGKVYIAYMGSSRGHSRDDVVTSHVELLSSVLGSHENAEQSLIHSYTSGFTGFSAVLSKEQATALAGKPGVLSVFPDPVLTLHTTHSWDFLQTESGLPSGSYPSTSGGSDTIIGLLDTGVWPEAASFSDNGIGPIPSRWKGPKPIWTKSMTPRDAQGHGTHTASTAGGNTVENADYYGLANGTARGGSTTSRIAIYRVCSEDGCQGSQILAAFEDAINDGVDVLSLSLGTPSIFQLDYINDPIAIGAFHATQKGILVVCSAGNDGPDPQTVVNAAPWIFTVAATTIDRQFRSNVVLGNRKTIEGEAINFSNLTRSNMHPLVYAGSIAANSSTAEEASNCYPDSLDATKAKGKVVLCINSDMGLSRVSKKRAVKEAGGVGIIVADDSQRSVASNYGTFPSTTVSNVSATQILSYINSTSKPVATILPTTCDTNYRPAPVVAYFSSRGPGALTENILKPDIGAPGVNILAAWIPTNQSSDAVPAGVKSSQYNIISGTSMACPHVSGASAFVKSMNPGWSASAIRSALITTATTMNNMGKPMTNDSDILATPFDFGAGEANPLRALDPGLVYETTSDDYFVFLCNYGLDSNQIKTIAGNESYNCPSGAKTDQISNMNYPTIAISKLDLNGNKTVSRAVTNVGSDQDSVYKVAVDAPRGLNVKVSPDNLQFSKTSNKLSFNVVFTASNVATKGYTFGSITWTDGKHNVRTPFAVNVV
eukprot:Gb_39463 [translate_table: standard]